MQPRLAFIGLGYLGATYAVCFAELGYEVLGVDIDSIKVKSLSSGTSPFYEEGLDELLQRNLAAGRLTFSTDYADAATFADIHFLCVGTPQHAGRSGADLSQLEAAVRALVPLLHRKVLVVGKSTVPVGTAGWVEKLIGELAPAHAEIEVAWCPEFLQESQAVQNVLRPSRIVVGARTAWATRQLQAAHAGIHALAAQEGREIPEVVTDFATAELAKVSANAFLATKISFINAVADVCEAVGADIAALARTVGLDPRIGPALLGAGIGFGGGCLPKDLRAFQSRADDFGVGDSLRMLQEVDRLNQSRRTRAVSVATRMLGRGLGPAGPELRGTRIAVLGLTFKPNTDDVRDSPALDIAVRLFRAGAQVSAYDPMGMANARREHPELGYAEDWQEAARDADLVCLLTPWQELCDVSPESMRKLVAHPRILDGRNGLNVDAWIRAGWVYRGVGRGPA